MPVILRTYWYTAPVLILSRFSEKMREVAASRTVWRDRIEEFCAAAARMQLAALAAR